MATEAEIERALDRLTQVEGMLFFVSNHFQAQMDGQSENWFACEALQGAQSLLDGCYSVLMDARSSGQLVADGQAT
jgi:hypothetical protein